MPFGRVRGGLCGLLAILYLVLAQSALACALHHGLDGACAHQAAAHSGMEPGTAHAGMDPAMPGGPLPDGDAPAPGAHLSLCHCLDNLAAEAPALLVTAVFMPPLPPLPADPTAPAKGPAHGSAAPRGPPTSLPA